MKVTLLILLAFLVGCNNEEAKSKVPRGKGKIYGKLNERKIPCRLVKIERTDVFTRGAVQCVYDHPQSDVHDRVTVGQHYMCPKKIYCDKR